MQAPRRNKNTMEIKLQYKNFIDSFKYGHFHGHLQMETRRFKVKFEGEET